MRKSLTRVALGAAAVVLASAATPDAAHAAIYRSFGCISWVNNACAVVQYCEASTDDNYWFCSDSSGGYQEGTISSPSSPLIASSSRGAGKGPPLSRERAAAMLSQARTTLG